MDNAGTVIYTEKPELRHPAMVCGISGWVNGGESATGSVQYLVRKLGAKKFAEIPIERFHIFQTPGQLSLRPRVRVENGLIKEHSFPQNQFYYWVNPKATGDLILFLGTEPNLNWPEYIAAILNIAKEHSVTRIYHLGGVMDKTPHTRDPGVSCACSNEQLKEEMQKHDVRLTNYEGPGSFGSTLQYICQQQQVPMVGFMVRATYYPEFNVVIPHNPRAIKAIVTRLDSLFHLNLDMSDLDRESKELETKLELMASQDAAFKTYLEELEKDFAKFKQEDSLEISPDEAIQIAEELLKRGEEKEEE